MMAAIWSAGSDPVYLSPFTKKVGVASTPEFLSAFLGQRDLLLEFLIVQAGGETGLGESGQFGDVQERRRRIFRASPLILLVEKDVDHGRAFGVVTSAARQHEGGEGARVEGKLPNDQLRLAGIDVVCLDRWIAILVEIGAMTASHRGVLDDGDGRVWVADHYIRQRTLGHELGDVHRRSGLRRLGARRC